MNETGYWQTDETGAAVFYFQRLADAKRAEERILQDGVPSEAVHLETKETDAGFLEGIRRFIRGDEADYGEGVLLRVDREYVERECVLNLRDGVDTETAMASSTRDQELGIESGNEEQRMPLREERLSVEKQPVQSGEVVVHKETVTETQSIDVPVKHEEVYVERRPASGATTSDRTIEGGDEIRIPVTKEDVSVEKHAVTAGEVVVGKRQVEDTERLEETLQREQPRVETSGEVTTRQSGTR